MIVGKVPLLGVCYGAQYLAYTNGGDVQASDTREYGRANLCMVNTEDELLKNMTLDSQVWMSHGDTILDTGSDFQTICSTSDVEYAGFKVMNEQVWGIQFHPEVFHSTEGPTLISNFIHGICGCVGEWTPDNFADSTIKSLKERSEKRIR